MFVSLAASLCLAGQTPQMTELWRLDGLDSPESIIADGAGGYIVSNINGEATERNWRGYLARISADGELVERHWATSLQAPKGMAIHEGRLFVSDIDHVVEIELATGTLLSRHYLEGAGFLNDLVVLDGVVLAADSANSRIYALSDGVVSVWLEDEQLAGVNGLLVEENRLLVTTMSAGDVLAVTGPDRTISRLLTGLENADGIGAIAGGYLISQWPGRLSYWAENTTRSNDTALIFDEVEAGIYMNDLLTEGERVLIPHWQPGEVSAWQVSCGRDASADH